MFRLGKLGILLGAGLFLAGCAGIERMAPIEEISAARVSTQAPPSISLITMINENSEFGEHSALLINGSQQIIYDPAGSFRHSALPRREDVIYGVTPQFADYYNSYHSRFGYYVKVQKLDISLEQADAMIASAEARGAVPKLFCATAISDVLNDYPQFTEIRGTFFPGAIMRRFTEVEGLETTFVRETDIGQNYRSE